MTARYDDTSLLVACRNEEATIEACLRSAAAALPGAEILVAVGGNDRTLDIARGLAAEIQRLVAFRNENDRGKGHAIKAAVRRAAGRFMVQFDADLQFRADDLPRLVDPLREDRADLVVGSRFTAGAGRSDSSKVLVRDMGNAILSLYASALAGRRMTDVTSGMKAWTREAIERIDFRDDRYSYEVEILIRAARLGLRLLEIPVEYTGRAAGQSMHRNSLAVARAGLVIMAKAFAARFRAAHS
ncbi:MAG: glycosyltransferase family 2 protein [Kiritimatiellae bacterium]|nr:glycosyltransferase family 2 protein [Kiritimatiellia bacterium]